MQPSGGYENSVSFWRLAQIRIAVATAISNQLMEAPKGGIIGRLEAAVKEAKAWDWSDVSLFQQKMRAHAPTVTHYFRSRRNSNTK